MSVCCQCAICINRSWTEKTLKTFLLKSDELFHLSKSPITKMCIQCCLPLPGQPQPLTNIAHLLAGSRYCNAKTCQWVLQFFMNSRRLWGSEETAHFYLSTVFFGRAIFEFHFLDHILKFSDFFEGKFSFVVRRIGCYPLSPAYSAKCCFSFFEIDEKFNHEIIVRARIRK